VTALARAIAVVIAGVAAGSVIFNLAAYRGAARYRRRYPVPCAEETFDRSLAGLLAWVGAFVREAAVTALLVLTVPFGLRRHRVRELGDGPARRPVVLLHGYAQHTANFLWLARRLRRDGWVHVYSVRHTALGGDIERSAARLGDVIDGIRRACGASHVDIVAHSMGGLVARACIRARGGASGIGRLITLGTPHQGTRVFSALRVEPMLLQMRPESPLLSRLGADDPVPSLVDCTAIYSVDDALVVPSSAAYYPGAFNIELRGLGHMSMLFSARVYELVRENLAPA